jgi:hypothetical protein
MAGGPPKRPRVHVTKRPGKEQPISASLTGLIGLSPPVKGVRSIVMEPKRHPRQTPRRAFDDAAQKPVSRFIPFPDLRAVFWPTTH